jgi:acyl carrier protein
MDTRQQIMKFITTNFYVGDSVMLTEETSLLDSGAVDSTGVLEIIAFLEEQFGIQIADDEMVPDNLDSVAKIANFVGKKKAA